MRIILGSHRTLVSRTRYVKRGCRCEQRNRWLRLDQQEELNATSREMFSPLTSTRISSRVLAACCNVKVPAVNSAVNSTDTKFSARTLSKVDILSVPHYQQIHGLVLVRHLHIKWPLYDKEPLKPSSKVEQTVQALKQDLKESDKPAAIEKPVKKPLRQRIVDELLHYYHGFRLLFIDVNVSRKLLWRLLRGKSLTRREHRLFVRTVADMFRLVPFSVFIIVPFMEFLLPVVIKLFPGMLPSTFQTATDKETKMKQSLKVKLEMAKFLQKTLDDMAVQKKGSTSDATKGFTEFFAKVRSSGEEATTEEILKFSQLFEDEITLDSLQRPQLVALCKVLEMQTLGTNNFLRFQLRMKLRSLAADDKMIQKEGIDSLTLSELQQACRARGMRAYGVSEARLKSQLAQWLDLSLHEKVPPSLLLLSRALLLPDSVPASVQLKATISVLPDAAVTHAKAAIGEREGKIDNKTKIEVIKEEVRKIKEERQELREEQKVAEELVDKAPIIIAGHKTIKGIDIAAVKKELTSTDIEKLEDALDSVSKERKKMLVEKEELDDLKEELADYQEDVDDLKQVLSAAGDPKVQIKERKGAQRLFKKVSNMISNMDAVLAHLEREEKQIKKDLETKALQDIDSNLKSEELISIEELIDAIKKLQKVPDESLVQRISEVLAQIDCDRDGSIRVDDVLKVIELVGKQNVKLTKKQMDEIIDLMSKEEIIELEEQIEKVLEKETLQRVAEKKCEKLAEQLAEADVSKSATAMKASDSQKSTVSEPKDCNDTPKKL